MYNSRGPTRNDGLVEVLKFKTELQHLKQVFHNDNGYPTWFINKTIQEVRAQFSKTSQPKKKDDKNANEGKEKEKE